MFRLNGPIFFRNENSIRVIGEGKQTFINPRYIESVSVTKGTDTITVVFTTMNDGKYSFITSVVVDAEGKHATVNDAYDSLVGHIHGMFK